jgi:glutaconyl-CoA decarboxylase
MRHYEIKVNDSAYSIDVEDTGPDTFQVTLDGTALDVVLESAEGDAGAVQVASGPISAPAPTPARTVSTGGGGAPGGSFLAPMPGVVLSVAVKVGDTVERGQTLLVLEAMKMKNELKSPNAGTISNLHVGAGDRVNTGDPLVDF